MNKFFVSLFLFSSFFSFFFASDDVAMSSCTRMPKEVEENNIKEDEQFSKDSQRNKDISPHNYFTGEVSFLCWRAQNLGFIYGYRASLIESVNLPSYSYKNTDVDSFSIKSHYTPGFRIKLQANTWHDDWTFFTQWTNFRTRRVDSVDEETKNVLDSDIFLPMYFNKIVDDLHSSWKLIYNTVDLSLNKTFYPSSCIYLCASSRFAFNWIYQKFHFKGIFEGKSEFIYRTFYGKNNTFGAGPKGALDIYWNIWEKLSLENFLALSLFYSRIETHAIEKRVQIIDKPGQSTQTDIVEENFRKKIHAVIPQIAYALGLSWNRDFYEGKLNLKLDALWEINYWFNQYNLNNFQYDMTADPTDKPLFMQGLTFDVAFTF